MNFEKQMTILSIDKKGKLSQAEMLAAVYRKQIVKDGTEFAVVKLRLKENYRGQILKDLYNPQELDLTLGYGGH